MKHLFVCLFSICIFSLRCWSSFLKSGLVSNGWDFYWRIVDVQCKLQVYSIVSQLYSYIYSFQILFHCNLLQDMGYSSLRYPGRPCRLSPIYIVICNLGLWRRQWHPAPVLLPGKSHGWRSLVGCMGLRRVGHDWATSLSLFTFMCWRKKWQPTPVFLPGESQGRRSLVGCCLWGHTESDTTEAT